MAINALACGAYSLSAAEGNVHCRDIETLGCVENKTCINRPFSASKILKKLLKGVDMLCIRCYNIRVSRESYALDEGGNPMTLEALKQAEQRTVGVKQTQKAVARQAAEVVYIACDADERVTGKLLELCEANHVPTVTTESMLEIGRACSINVKAAAAAVLKP